MTPSTITSPDSVLWKDCPRNSSPSGNHSATMKAAKRRTTGRMPVYTASYVGVTMAHAAVAISPRTAVRRSAGEGKRCMS